MICVIVSVVTLVAACNEQDPRVELHASRAKPCPIFRRRPSGASPTPAADRLKLVTDRGRSLPLRCDHFFVVHVYLKTHRMIGGWSSKNTLLHLLARTSCLANAILLKNRTGYVAALVWSGSLALFLVAIVADVATVMTWRHDCYLLGLVLADEVSNSVLQSRFSTLERASALQNATIECHVWPRAIGFTILFAATGCLCCGRQHHVFP
ncbi:hypothetical protein H257_18592, partial [Aphanomyces astaci]